MKKIDMSQVRHPTKGIPPTCSSISDPSRTWCPSLRQVPFPPVTLVEPAEALRTPGYRHWSKRAESSRFDHADTGIFSSMSEVEHAEKGQGLIRDGEVGCGHMLANHYLGSSDSPLLARVMTFREATAMVLCQRSPSLDM